MSRWSALVVFVLAVGCGATAPPETTATASAGDDDLDLSPGARRRAARRGSARTPQGITTRAVIGGAREPGRTGELIDLELVAADLHNALRLIAEAGKINLVVSDDVSGTISIRLRRVSYRQALRAVLAKAGLVAVRHGAVTQVVRRRR